MELAGTVAERIRIGSHAIILVAADLKLSLTASFGVAAFRNMPPRHNSLLPRRHRDVRSKAANKTVFVSRALARPKNPQEVNPTTDIVEHGDEKPFPDSAKIEDQTICPVNWFVLDE